MGSSQSRFNTQNLVNTYAGALGDKYEVIKQLGAGAQGAAHLVKRKDTGDRYVAKETHDMSPEGIQDFLAEFEKMRDLQHPNIAKVVELIKGKELVDGKWQNCLYVISEVADGSDLYKFMAKAMKKPQYFTEEFVAGIFQQAMQGVAFAHTNGIIHNDLKPDNILMMEDFKPKHIPMVKVNDFGCSQLARDNRFNCGDPRYQSPEVWVEMMKIIDEDCTENPQKCDEKADVWSMGATLFELLSGGRLPFWYKPCTLHEVCGTEGVLMELGAKIMAPDEVDMSYCEGISPEGADLVRKMLVKDPKQRPSATDVLNHKWFQIKGKKVNPQMIKRLAFMTSKGAAHQMLLTAMATKLQHEHLQDVLPVFRQVDQDHSGLIDKEEFRQALQKLGKNGDDADAIFARGDVDGSGKLDFNEFVATTFNWKDMDESALDHKLSNFVNDLDTDGSGHVDEKELVKLFHGVLTLQQVKEVFQIIDINKDGVLSKQEFKHFLFEPATEEEVTLLAAQKKAPPPCCMACLE